MVAAWLGPGSCDREARVDLQAGARRFGRHLQERSDRGADKCPKLNSQFGFLASARKSGAAVPRWISPQEKADLFEEAIGSRLVLQK
jgi:hypothetical protein